MKNINVQVGWYYIQPSHWCDRVVLIIIGLVYICIAQYSRFRFRSKIVHRVVVEQLQQQITQIIHHTPAIRYT